LGKGRQGDRISNLLSVTDDSILRAVMWEVLDGVKDEHIGHGRRWNIKPLGDLLNG
jgi:hypothetical protein